MLQPAQPWPTAITTCSRHPLQLIQKNNVKAVHALSSARDLALVLCGQSPAVILEVAHVAIEFCEAAQGVELGGSGSRSGQYLSAHICPAPSCLMVH